MPLRYDATIKGIAEDDPAAFVAKLDAPPNGPVRMLNVDLSTISAAADLVFGIGHPVVRAVHVDCQSRAKKDGDVGLLCYNALLRQRLKVPVQCVLLLLHPRAEHSSVDGRVHYGDTEAYTDFRYRIVRLWKLPVEELMLWPANLLPLATLGRLPEGVPLNDALAEVVNRVLTRLAGEVDHERFRRLATAAFVFTGMKVSRVVAKSMFLGVQDMQDSDTYQMIVEEGEAKGLLKGRIQEAKRMLLRLGKKRYGAPTARIRKTLMAIKYLDRLEMLSEKLLDVGSWKELLAD